MWREPLNIDVADTKREKEQPVSDKTIRSKNNTSLIISLVIIINWSTNSLH
jgi:hypothetical protein